MTRSTSKPLLYFATLFLCAHSVDADPSGASKLTALTEQNLEAQTEIDEAYRAYLDEIRTAYIKGLENLHDGFRKRGDLQNVLKIKALITEADDSPGALVPASNPPPGVGQLQRAWHSAYIRAQKTRVGKLNHVYQAYLVKLEDAKRALTRANQ